MSLVFEEIPVNLKFFSILVIFNRVEEVIERIEFLKEFTSKGKNPFIESLITQVFYGKRKIDINLLNLNPLTDFQKKVLIETLGLPRGKVTTYRNLSMRVGSPFGARSVGNVLKINPFPIVIPCHRVIKSDRTIGNYGGGKVLKRKLIIFEGVKFGRDGKILKECVV